MRRIVFIVKQGNVANVDAVANHANITKCWKLPGEILLLEFYDPVFQRLHNDDPAVVKAAYQDESIRQRRMALDDELRTLFAPLYRDSERVSDRVVALIPSKTTNYEFLGHDKHRIAWPELGISPGWEHSRRIVVTGCLFAAVPETLGALNDAFGDWRIATSAETAVVGPVSVTGRDFIADCEFSNPSGDALIALYAVLTDSRALTSIERVGFFLPGGAPHRYLKIGHSN